VAASINPQALQKAFGLALRNQRHESGLSQEELEFRSGVHRTYVSELERALKSPSLTTISKLAQALEVMPSSLVAAAERLSRKC